MELSVRRLFLPGGTQSAGPQLFSSTRLCESDICAKENRQCISTLAVFSWARVDYASRASKKAPQGPFCRRDVWRRPQLFESTLGYALKSFGQKKNSSIFTTLEFLVGAGGFEPPKLKSSRFTVCPHWPLGNTPRYSSSQSRTACIYYHSGAYLSTAFYSFFRKEADRTAQSRGRP